MRELSLGEALYKKGEKSNFFYFLLRGQLHVTVVESAQTKFSHTHEENTFLGFRECSMERNDFACSKAKQTEVIQIDTNVYKSIITQTQLSVSLEKIDFIMRFVPHLRDGEGCGLAQVKKEEVQFMKEEYSKGFRILNQSAKDEHLYFIFKGKVRLLLSTRIPPMASVFPLMV